MRRGLFEVSAHETPGYLSLVYLSGFINQLKPDAQAREDKGGQLPATHKPFLISSHPHRCDRWTPVGLEHNSARKQSVCVLFVCAPGHTVYICVYVCVCFAES